MLLVLVAASAHCAPVSVAIGKEMPSAFSAKMLERVSKNFEVAYSQACASNYLAKPLIDAGAKDRRLFLHNAPNANAASIYLNSDRMLLEYPFISENGTTQVPGKQQLLEAIYCAAHGASAKEQEESGRCLPD